MGGSYQEKSLVCIDCSKCKGRPPILDDSPAPEAITKQVVIRIEEIIKTLNAGMPFDWNSIEFADWQLVAVWRDAEAYFERKFKIHTRMLFEALTRQN